MNSDILKNAILKHFRFKRQYIYCATEVLDGFGIADILLSKGSEIIEIEIKISYSDFVKDFKKYKHKNLLHLKAHKFYFCIPAKIEDKCLKYLNDNNYPYGLYSFNGELTLIKRCKKLKVLSENEIMRINDNIIRRATSELLKLRFGKYGEV